MADVLTKCQVRIAGPIVHRWYVRPTLGSGCSQNEDLRPIFKDRKTKTCFLQAYQTRDGQTGSRLFLGRQLTQNQWVFVLLIRPARTIKRRPSLKCFVRCQRTRNQWGLRFIDKADSNYKTKTLASKLC